MEETKITTVEKVKNPKRVEHGKRLAAISREAKARKAAEHAGKRVRRKCKYILFGSRYCSCCWS